MEKRKDLTTKAALAALVLAATLPTNGQTSSLPVIQESFLATGSLATNESSNRGGNNNSSGTYGNTNANGSYTGTSSGVGTGDSGYSGTSGYSKSTSGNFGKTSGSYNDTDAERMNRDINSSRNTNETYNSTRTSNDSYDNSNTNRANNQNLSYKEMYGYRELAVNNPEASDVNANSNHAYNTANEDEDNRTAAHPSSSNLTEAQLLDVLSPQGRAIYMSLNAEGKGLALQLASRDSYRDKNLAVKEAQRKMNEKRGLISR